MTPNDIQQLMNLLHRLQKEAEEIKEENQRLKEKLKQYEDQDCESNGQYAPKVESILQPRDGCDL